VPPGRALLGGFRIGERVSLLWQHSAECEISASVCTRSVPGLLLSNDGGYEGWEIHPSSPLVRGYQFNISVSLLSFDTKFSKFPLAACRRTPVVVLQPLVVACL